jgi:molecular chaperone DnaK
MVRDAEAHAAEDKRRREVIEIKNQSDSLAYQAERTLTDLGDKVEPAQKAKVETLVKDLREAIAQEEEERMKTLSAELQQLLYQVSQSANAAEGPQPGAGVGANGAAKSKDEGVVEGEYTVD